MRHSMLLLGAILALQGCAPNWQPSWNTSRNAAIPTVDSLTLRRVTVGDTTAEVLRTENLDYEAMRAPATPPTQMTPDDALRLCGPAQLERLHGELRRRLHKRVDGLQRHDCARLRAP
ncbi:MAG: hypothetical protein ACK4Y5_06440, partial [Acetobacteraceae bacterium]